MTNKWVGIPAVPKGSPGEYTFWDAIKQNLQLAQSQVDTLSTAAASGTGSVLAGTGLTGGGSVSTNPTISAGPDLAAIAALTSTGYLQRTGPGSYIITPTIAGGAPGDSYAGDPHGSQPSGWIHEDTLTGNLWAAGPSTIPATPSIVNYRTVNAAVVTTGGTHYELTLPFTPTAGNLVIVAVFNGSFTTAPSGWTIIHQANGAFTTSTWYAKVWTSADLPYVGVWPDAQPLHCYEISGVGTGTVASAFDAGQTVGVTGGAVSGFSFATAVDGELALCIGVTSSIYETTLGMDASWTMDDTSGFGTGSAAHKVIPTAGTTVTGTQVSGGAYTNRNLSVVTLKPGVITVNSWNFIGPVASYSAGTRVDKRMRSLNVTGNASLTSDGYGGLTINVPTLSASVVSHFGVGAPTTLYADGDQYFDTTTTPYAEYVQNAGAWVAVGSSGGGSGALAVGTTSVTGGIAGAILYDNAGVLGNISILPVANGGTGTATPSIVAGANVSVTGTWPNQTISASGGGGGGSLTVSGPTTSAPPTPRGSSSALYNSAAPTVTWPTGTILGDFVVIGIESAYAVTTPTGWTALDNSGHGSTSFGLFTKIMTAADITAGGVTITCGGSYDGVWGCVSFQGATGGTRAFGTAFGGSPLVPTTSGSPIAGDYEIVFGFARAASSTITSSDGTLLQSKSAGGTDASGVVYGGTLAASGVVSPSVAFSAIDAFTSAGAYVVVVEGGAGVVSHTATEIDFSGAGVNVNFVGSVASVAISSTGGGSGASVSFGTGTPSSSSVTPSVEGSPVTSTFSGGTSSSITFSTTAANRVAVLVLGMEVNGATLSLTSVTSPHLTWHKRTGFSSAATRGSTSTVEIWWASVPSIVTSEVVSFTLSATVDDAALGVFVVKDLADITSPWDPNGGLPVQNSSSSPGSVVAAAPVFSTTNPNGLAFTASWSSNATNDTASWTALFNANNGGGANWGFLTTFQQSFATAQASTTAGLTSGDGNLTTRMVDVLTGYRGAAPSEGSIYFDTSVSPYQGYVYHSVAWHTFT